jgi:hypothetical protein
VHRGAACPAALLLLPAICSICLARQKRLLQARLGINRATRGGAAAALAAAPCLLLGRGQAGAEDLIVCAGAAEEHEEANNLKQRRRGRWRLRDEG